MTTILSTMTEGVIVHDAGGRIDWCNASAERILGLSAGQMAGLTSVDPGAIREDGSPFPGESQPAMVTLRTGQPQAGVIVGVHKPDGSVAWLCVNSQALLENGKLQGTVTTFREVAPRQGEGRDGIPQEDLRSSEEEFAKVFSSNPAALSINCLEDDGRFVAVNEAFERMTGYRREEVIGVTVTELGLWADPAQRQEALALFRSEGKVRQIEHQYRRKDREIRTGLLSMEPLRVGKTLYGIASVVDITERKLAETALRDSARLNQQILDCAREGIIVCSPDLKYQVWNRHMEELSGMPASKVLGRHMLEVFPFLRDSGVVERYESILAGGESKEIDFPYSVPETGRSGWVSHVNTALRDESGTIIGVMATVKEITGRKLAERQRIESEKRFHQLFDCAPISLWEVDFSAVKKYLDQVDAKVFGDLAGYFASRPEELVWCVNQVKILDLNRATDELFEAENKAELLSRFRQVVTPGSLDVLKNGLVEVHGGQTRFRQEAAFRTLKGRTIICDVQVTPAPGFEDSWSIVLISAADITERKRAEADLAKEKALSDAVINGLPGVFYMFDQHRRLVRWNQEFLNAAGATAEEASRTIATDRVVDADKKKAAAAIETAFSAGESSVEARVVTKDGVRTYDFAVRRLQTAEGPYLLGTGYDITDRKRAEGALRQSEAKFRAIVENSHEGIVFVDAEDVLLYRSPALESITGFTAEEREGRNALDLVHDDDRAAVMAAWRAGLAHPDTLGQAQYRLRQKNGGYRWVEAAFKNMLDNPDVRALVATVRDVTERKNAEDALRKSEAAYRLLADNVSDVIWVFDLEDFRMRYVSPSIERQTGYTVEEYLALGPLATLDEASTQALREELPKRADAFNQGTNRVYRDEIQQRRRDGSPLWIEVTSRYSRNRETGHIEAFGVSRDITERKKVESALLLSEQKLRESIQQYRTLTKCIPDIIWSMDLSGKYTYVNAAVERIYGWTVEEYLKLTRRDTSTPGQIVKSDLLINDELQKARSEENYDRNTVLSLETERVRKDGSTFWAEVNASFIWSEDGQPVGWTGVTRDITARKRIEEERSRLATAIDQAQETVVITDVDANILYVNPAFERTSGYDAKEVLGRNPRILQSGRHDAAFYRDMWDTLRRGEVWRGRLHNRRKDGTFYDEESTISPVRDESGRIVNYIGVKLDVTREAELQAQLSQAQKLESIGRLAGGVAHDFNNLLTVINGYSKLLLSKISPADPHAEGLREIHKAGERGAALTRQLLAFSRKQVMQPRVLDLNRVVADMQSLLQRLMSADVEVQLRLTPQRPSVHADPHQLEQVIMNLAVNARDAMPGGGRVVIETRLLEGSDGQSGFTPCAAAERYAVLAVSDNGTGMDQATRDRIFEPFFTTKETGSGLGLSMVQGIVEQSGGKIQVETEPGGGTRFRIYLPALNEPAAEVAAGDGWVERPGNESILVVEDQQEVGNYVSAVLKAHGYRVVQAATAAEALELCTSGAPVHMLITDVVMPHMSGKQLAMELSRVRPEIKVLFMSGHVDNPSLDLLEVQQFIQKPFSPDELAAKVRELLTPRTAVRILVADDEIGVRSFFQKVLELSGYQVLLAADGKEAVELALSSNVELVITDLAMPGQEGIETIQTLRRKSPDSGIIAVSGAFGGTFLEVARMLGADAVLAKPVGAELLLSTVEDVLSRRR